MSVIFQALQKLDTRLEPGRQSVDDDGTMQATAVQTRRRFAVRGFIVCGAVLFVILLGYGAVFGMRYFAGKVQSKSPETSQTYKLTPPQGHAAGPTTGEQPSVRPVAALSLQPQYFPPTTGADTPSVEILPAAGGTDPAGPIIPMNLTTSREDNPAPGVAAQIGSTPDTIGKAKHQAVHLGSVDTPAVSQVLPELSEPPQQFAQPEDIEARLAERKRQAALEKSARIGRLVAQLEDTLENPSQSGDRADELIKELSQLKGPDNPYVIKLQAFRLLKQGRHDQAERLLGKVIAADRDDLEAGLNLAVLEANTGRRAEALDRLKGLRQVYPDNTRIAELIRKIK